MQTLEGIWSGIASLAAQATGAYLSLSQHWCLAAEQLVANFLEAVYSNFEALVSMFLLKAALSLLAAIGRTSSCCSMVSRQQ